MISQTQKQKADIKFCMILAIDNDVVEVYKQMMAEAETNVATLKARLERDEEQKNDDSGSN
jgi:hypothetical protein